MNRLRDYMDWSGMEKRTLNSNNDEPRIFLRLMHYNDVMMSTMAKVNILVASLQWRHYGHYGVLNHQPHDCLLNRLFRRRSKKASKLRVTGLCEGNSHLITSSWVKSITIYGHACVNCKLTVGPILLTEISLASIEIMAWINNYIHIKVWGQTSRP